MVIVCTWGNPPVVVRSWTVLKELPFCSAVTCNKHALSAARMCKAFGVTALCKTLIVQLSSLAVQSQYGEVHHLGCLLLVAKSLIVQVSSLALVHGCKARLAEQVSNALHQR